MNGRIAQRLNGCTITDRTAIVTYKRVPVGRLSEAGDGTRFEYDDAWRTSIGCSLPADVRDHHWRSGLHPFFQHLLAEGWLRGVQGRAGRTNEQDDFAFLLNYGADCIGAVGVEPLEQDDRAHLIRPIDDPLAEAALRGRRTLSGVHKKLLAFREGERFHPSAQPADLATHIAKYNREDVTDLVWNENISLRLARDLLGADAVAAASIGTVTGVEGQALLVERFDREGATRLRLEDFAQILNKPRGVNFDGKYQSSYEELAAALTTFSARSRIDLDRYFRLVVFNVLIGNADAHLKNFSLLERPEGLRLSPAYDLVNSVVYDNRFDGALALELDGRKRELDSVDRTILERFAGDIGLPAPAATQALDQLASRLARSKVLRLPQIISGDDLRQRYHDVVFAQARRIFR